MKTLLLILSLLLSLFSGGKQQEAEAVVCSEDASYSDDSPKCDLFITAAEGQIFPGHRGSDSVSVRNTYTGRRTSPQTRSTVRMVKGGKVIDNNRTHPFLTPVFVPLSGIHISERYLLSIRRLRL